MAEDATTLAAQIRAEQSKAAQDRKDQQESRRLLAEMVAAGHAAVDFEVRSADQFLQWELAIAAFAEKAAAAGAEQKLRAAIDDLSGSVDEFARYAVQVVTAAVEGHGSGKAAELLAQSAGDEDTGFLSKVRRYMEELILLRVCGPERAVPGAVTISRMEKLEAAREALLGNPAPVAPMEELGQAVRVLLLIVRDLFNASWRLIEVVANNLSIEEFDNVSNGLRDTRTSFDGAAKQIRQLVLDGIVRHIVLPRAASPEQWLVDLLGVLPEIEHELGRLDYAAWYWRSALDGSLAGSLSVEQQQQELNRQGACGGIFQRLQQLYTQLGCSLVNDRGKRRAGGERAFREPATPSFDQEPSAPGVANDNGLPNQELDYDGLRIKYIVELTGGDNGPLPLPSWDRSGSFWDEQIAADLNLSPSEWKNLDRSQRAGRMEAGLRWRRERLADAPVTTTTDHAPSATGSSRQGEGADAKAKPKRRVRPSDLTHYLACQYALAKDSANKKTRDAWNYLNEHGIDERDNVAELIGCAVPAKLLAKLASYRPPEFSTFEPAVSKGRAAMNDLKHSSRAGRPFGKSVVHVDDLENRRTED